MSEVATSARRLRPTVARACSAAVLVMLASGETGCVITATPQFKPQQHTAPFLVPSSASPPADDVVIVDYGQTEVPMVTFSANVVSQDDLPDSTGLFQKVYSALYIDYGVEAAPDQPYLWDIQNGAPLAPGTLADTTPRTVSEDWYPSLYTVQPGCHTATLIVSHIFDDQTHCPVCDSDSTYITWQVLSCNSQTMGSCDSLPVSGSAACALQQNPGKATTCASVEVQAAAAICPSVSDAGAP